LYLIKHRIPKAVTTITPQRISFAGGGTDLPKFYSLGDGGVISTAINQYVYVSVKQHSPLFNEMYRLSYSKTEHVHSIDDIENKIARECLRMVDVPPPLYISTAADIPASSGLGSSSSFAVGLLHALHLMRGERVSPGQLAEEACRIEIDILGHQIGKQDQYAAAFGGLNQMTFKRDGTVTIENLVPRAGLIENIFNNSLLVWTGIQRNAEEILGRQNQSIDSHRDKYDRLLAKINRCRDLLLNPTPNFLKDFGDFIEEAWSTKKSLESSISGSDIDLIHQKVKTVGGFGGKLCGAGGGGFFFEVVHREFHQFVIQELGRHRTLNVGFEPHGSKVLFELH
jgi:D-glycero-alpha-D-manno-heptose-7-phosphate kinase